MKKIVLLLSALMILATTTDCSKRAYSTQEGLMLTNKYNQPNNKKKSKKAKKNWKKRQKAYQKPRK